MNWNDEHQKRFDDLRRRELAGMLTADEQAELTDMITLLEEEEAQYLGPAVARMELKQAAIQQRLQKLQAETSQQQLRERIRTLEQEVAELQATIAGLT